MDISSLNSTALPVLGSLAIGSTLYLVLDSLIGDEKRRVKRFKSATLSTEDIKLRLSSNDTQIRKRQVDAALKDLDAKSKRTDKHIPLSLRIKQAGLDWSTKKYYIFSIICAVVFAGLLLMISHKEIIALLGLIIGGIGFPAWMLNFRKKRRIAKYLHVLPDAVEVIVRGIKSGLPVVDCFRIISEESVEPVKSEFKNIVEAQSMGVPLGEAVELLYKNMPVAESNFFAIAISIQQKSGGNLAETLSNLARVLRERKKLKLKIISLISEAKASVMIIGALPLFVTCAVFFMNPEYIEILWTTDKGILLLIISAGMYATGLFVMHRMINFKF